MAEFGAIASAIGVAGVAAQFADGIRKLATFCRDVRSAPEDIQYAANELEILTNLLSRMEVDLRQRSFNGVADFSAVLRLCDLGSQQVSLLVVELGADIAKRRINGSLKAAWKRPDIDKHMVRLERAKSSLMLAQNAYSTALSQQHFGVVVAKLERLETPGTTPSQQLLRPPGAQPKAQTSLLPVTNGRLSQPRIKRKSCQAAVVRFPLPPWMLSQVWELGIGRATQGWDIKFRTYRVLSPVQEYAFNEACVNGDADAIRCMIFNGDILCTDLRTNGLPLIQMIMPCSAQFFKKNPDEPLALCNYMAERGLIVDDSFVSMLMCLAAPTFAASVKNVSRQALQLSETTKLNQQCIQVAELLVDYAYEHEEIEQVHHILHGILRDFSSPQTIGYIAQSACPPWDTSSVQHRVETLYDARAAIPTYTSPLELKAWIGSETWERTWDKCNVNTRSRLLRLMFASYGRSINVLASVPESAPEYESCSEHVEDWYVLIKGLMENATKLGEDMYDACGASSMMAFIHGFCYRLRQAYRSSNGIPTLQVALTAFAKAIQRLGVSLLYVGQIEKAVINAHAREWGDITWYTGKWVTESWNPDGTDDSCIRLIGFEYGEKIEDWRFWLSDDLDEWSAEFWDMIEHPERAIPGAWTFGEEEEEG